MLVPGSSEKHHRRRSPWLSRVTVTLAVLLAAFWIFMLLGHLLGDEPHQADVPWTEYLRGPGLITLSVVVLLVAIWRPLGGGVALSVCAVVVAVAVFKPLSAAVIIAGPFLVVGVLSVLRGRLARNRQSATP